MKIHARFYVDSVTHLGFPEYDAATKTTTHGGCLGIEVHMAAIYSASDDDPNRSFAKATPSASLKMQIDNPDAFDAFQPGHIYDITFAEADK